MSSRYLSLVVVSSARELASDILERSSSMALESARGIPQAGRHFAQSSNWALRETRSREDATLTRNDCDVPRIVSTLIFDVRNVTYLLHLL